MLNPTKRVKSIELSQIRKMFEVADKNAISLSLGEPDFDIPEHAKKAMIQAVKNGYTHYTPNKGFIELRERIAKKLKNDNNLDFDSEEIIVTNGASEGLYMCSQALFEKGDEVLIPDPGFLSYDACVKLSEAKSVPVDLRKENGFKMTVEDVEEKLTSKTKAIILNSPSNPTGAVIEKEDIKAIGELADEKGFYIISDEIYEKIIYDKKHYSPSEFSDNTILINGFSKTYAMTGLRVAYTAANEEITEELLKVHQYNTACASSISQIGAYAALKGSEKYIEKMLNEFKRRRDLIYNRIDNLGFECLKPEGAFYIFADVGNTDEFLKKSIAAGVLTVNGQAFGDNGKNHVRMSYATSYDLIEEAMDRLDSVFN